MSSIASAVDSLSRARLRQLLGVRLGVRPESIELACGERGKPALACSVAGSGLRFNVAHSNDVAAYTFSPEREIGIDIEAIRAVSEADNIAARFFSRRER